MTDPRLHLAGHICPSCGDAVEELKNVTEVLCTREGCTPPGPHDLLLKPGRWLCSRQEARIAYLEKGPHAALAEVDEALGYYHGQTRAEAIGSLKAASRERDKLKERLDTKDQLTASRAEVDTLTRKNTEIWQALVNSGEQLGLVRRQIDLIEQDRDQLLAEIAKLKPPNTPRET